MTTDTDIIIALARKLEAENTRLRAENTALRAGQGRWPDCDDFPCCGGDRAKLQAEVDQLAHALRLASREKDEWEANYTELADSTPRVISAEELHSGASVASFTDCGTPVAGIVTGEATDKVVLLVRNDDLITLDTERRFILLEDAPTSDDDDDHRDAVVTSETIRASEPGSTWENSSGNVREVWDWNGKALIGRSTGRNSGPVFASDHWGPFTHSTAAPRGDYGTAPRLTVHALNTAPVGSLVTWPGGSWLEKSAHGSWMGVKDEDVLTLGDDATLTYPEATP